MLWGPAEEVSTNQLHELNFGFESSSGARNTVSGHQSGISNHPSVRGAVHQVIRHCQNKSPITGMIP